VQELRAATVRRDERDVMRTLRRVAGRALAAAVDPGPRSPAVLLWPPYPPSQPLPPPPLYPIDASFPAAARASGLLWAVASAVDAAKTWPPRLHLAALSTWVTLLGHPQNRMHTLAHSHAILVVDRLQQHLDAALAAMSAHGVDGSSDFLSSGAPLDTASSASGSIAGAGDAASTSTVASPVATPRSMPGPVAPTALLEAYLCLLTTLLATEPPSAALRGRRCDLIAYALACGIGYRAAQLLSLFDRAVAGTYALPTWLQHCLLLLRVLSAGDAPLAAALGDDKFADRDEGARALLAGLDKDARHTLHCKGEARFCHADTSMQCTWKHSCCSRLQTFQPHSCSTF
jgi:hypothetical protein